MYSTTHGREARARTPRASQPLYNLSLCESGGAGNLWGIACYKPDSCVGFDSTFDVALRGAFTLE